MFTELSFSRCYVNGKKAGLASYSDNTNRLLYFGTSLGEGVGIGEIRNAGVSLHQFTNSIIIPSADASGVAAVLAGAVVELEGSPEYNARVAAATGSRSGNKVENSAPAVVSADAFQVPALTECPALYDMVKNMAPVVDSLNSWAAECSTALLGGADAVGAPACIDQLSVFMPGVVDGFKAYQAVICNAINDHREKIAALETERKAAEESARRAAEAAANGKKLITLADGSTVEVSGKVHAAFADVCLNAKYGIHTYIYGPAGTGKTYLCKQVAASLGLEFYSDQKISNDFQLTGFVDASGKYQETELYRAATRGGVYMLDEFDASDECAAVVLNTALANGYMTFPGVGRVDLHKDFHVIACGNTIGRGADTDYTGRNCLDAATLDRFAVLSVGYDPEIELAKAGGDQDLIAFIHAVRNAVKTCGVSLVVSMRAIENIAKVQKFYDAEKCLSMMLFKGLEKDQINQISGAVSGRGKWFDALKALAA